MTNLCFEDWQYAVDKIEEYAFTDDRWDCMDFEDLCLLKGHINKHFERSVSEMLKEILDDPNKHISSFNSKEEALDFVKMALYYKAKDIATWLTNNESEFQNKYNKRTFEIQVDMKEPVGFGYSSNLEKLNSNFITVMLKRDKDSPVGFHVVTAYPNLDRDKQRTGKYITQNDIEKMDNIYNGRGLYSQFLLLMKNGQICGLKIDKFMDPYICYTQIHNGYKIVACLHNQSKFNSIQIYKNENLIKKVNIEDLIFYGLEKQAKNIAGIINGIENNKLAKQTQEYDIAI